MKFEVEKEMVEPIIREQIAAAVVAQMGDATALIMKAVALALDQRVDHNGKPSTYRSDRAHTYLQWLCTSEIQAAAKAAVQAIVAEERPKIEKAVKDHLRRSPAKMATALVSAFADRVNPGYHLACHFEFKSD